MINSYETLLEAAKKQTQAQRLLFVFLKASLPKERVDDEVDRFYAGQGGQLQPVMCVDKSLNELGSFESLVEESKHMGQDWAIVLVAALSGRDGKEPSSADAEVPMKIMMHAVENGGDLSKYMAFDKQGIPIKFSM